MANANSSASNLRPKAESIVEGLNRLEDRLAKGRVEKAGVDTGRAAAGARRLASGVYSFVAPLLRPNAYAGLERLDRAELDEADEG